MRIKHQDTKNGIMEIVPETLDDLWHLSHIIEEGDLLSSKTTRRIQDNTGDKLRSDRGIKKTFYMGIRVETISFHKFTGKLRATGAIEIGPEEFVPLGSHHTIEVKLNYPIKISKEHWSIWTLKRIKQAIDASKKFSTMIIIIEDDMADIALLRQFGIDYYGPIIGNVAGKRIIDKNRGKDKINFYESIVSAINKFKEIQTIILAGPGFVKGEFWDYISQKHKDIAKKSIVENTGTGGRVGVQEILKKGIVDKLTSENRIAIETAAVNEILSEIAKSGAKRNKINSNSNSSGISRNANANGKSNTPNTSNTSNNTSNAGNTSNTNSSSNSNNNVIYGKKEVINAANLGAVNKLLVIDIFVRDGEVEAIMDLVENMSGEVMVISTEHEGGEQLKALGGLAAKLRYAIN